MSETEGFPPKADQVSGINNKTCQIPSSPARDNCKISFRVSWNRKF